MDSDNQDYQEEEQDEESDNRRRYLDQYKKLKNLSSWANRAGKTAARLRQIASSARVAAAAVSTSEIWVPVLIIILVIILVVIIWIYFFSGKDKGDGIRYEPFTATAPEPDTGEIIPGVTLTVTSQGQVSGIPNETGNGENIVYNITITYDVRIFNPLGKSVFDIIPPGTDFITATSPSPQPPYLYRSTPFPYVEFLLMMPPVTTPPTYVWSMSWVVLVEPTVTDTYVYNNVTVAGTGSIPSVLGASTTSLNKKTGLGEINPTTQNVEFSKENLYQLLLALDPKNVDTWFYKIIPCESSFDPEFKKINSSELQTLGLFQLVNQSGNPNISVPWEEQVKTAVEYNNSKLNGSFSYWACSK